MKRLAHSMHTPHLLALAMLTLSSVLPVSAFAESMEPMMCTMEALQCPDGSYVSRTGPNCEFSPCPGGEGPETTPPTNTPPEIRNGEGEGTPGDPGPGAMPPVSE